MKKEHGNTEKYNPLIHHRRSIRLKGYDYSRPGAYFVTICLDDKDNWILGKVVSGCMCLSRYGEIVWKCWHQLPKHYSNIKLDEFVVMPNHVHGVIFLIGAGDGDGAGAGDGGANVGAGLHRRKYGDVKPARTMDDNAHDAHGAEYDRMPAARAAWDGQHAQIGDDAKSARRMDGDKGKIIHPLSEIIRGFKTFSARRINDLRGTAGVSVWQRNYWEHIVRNDGELQRIREYIVNNPAKWRKDGFWQEK